MTPDALAALHAACFTRPRPWTAAEFASLLASPFTFLVAQGGGFALGRAVAGEAELMTIAVPPVARRQGQGRALLTAFLAEALVRGADSAFLEVAADNRPAIGLYRAGGFAETGRRRGYYADAAGGVDALIMARALP